MPPTPAGAAASAATSLVFGHAVPASLAVLLPLVAAAVVLLLLLLARCVFGRSGPPPRMPSWGPASRDGDGRALLRRLREDAFLVALARARALASPGPQPRTLLVDGCVSTSDPRVLRALLLSKAHSVGRSAVYRLVAWTLPSSDGILFAADADWRRRHSLLTPLFTSSHVALFTGSIFAGAVRAAEAAIAVSASTEVESTPAAHLRGSSLLDEAVGQRGGHQAPLGLGRGPSNEAARTRRDLLTFVRWATMRPLLAWAFGFPEDAERDCSADGEPMGVDEAAALAAGSASSAGTDESRRVARLLDAYARTCFEAMPDAQSAPSWALWRWLGEYRMLFRLATLLRDALQPQIRRAKLAAAAAATAASAPSPSPIAAPQSCLHRMVAAGWSEADIVSEANHIHGAHKAAAFLASSALFELSSHAEARADCVRELEAVCGKPPPGATAAQLIAQARAALGEGADAGASVGAAPVSGGWRPPTRADIEAGRLPFVMKCVMRETLRRHVVSMGTLRRLGGDFELPAPAALVPPLSKDVGEGADEGGAAPAPSAAGPTLPAGTDVMLLLHALHHEAALWGDDAHVWEPRRWDARSVYWARRREREGAGPGGAGGNADVAADGDDGSGFPARAPDCFYPFLDGSRRCAGILLAQLEFVVLLYACLVVYNVRALLPAPPSVPLAAALDDGESLGGGLAVGAARLLRRPAAGSAVAVLADRSAEATGGVRHHLVMRPDFFSAFDGDIAYSCERRRPHAEGSPVAADAAAGAAEDGAASARRRK